MPETHMLKPYADRYDSMRAFVETVFAFTADHADQIQLLRKTAREKKPGKEGWPVKWTVDRSKVSKFKFKGYEAVYGPSNIGNYVRLTYDRSKPWEKEIDYYDHFAPEVSVAVPDSYVIPQEWREVVRRMEWNKVSMQRVTQTHQRTVQTYHISDVKTRATPYEGHMFHDEVELETRAETVTIKAGDYIVSTSQNAARYVVETLEPQAHDSFFRWGFFNSILEKKETFSDYVFEDTAAELLETEPELKIQFDNWKRENQQLLSDQQAVLNFIFTHCKRFHEPEWRRYPIFRLV
jgi:hypothetical protein